MNDRAVDTGLDVVFGVGGETITVGGETIEIKPANFGQCAMAIKNCSAFLFSIVDEQESARRDGRKENVLAVFSRHFDDAIDLVSVFVGKDRRWLEALPADDAVKLIARLYEVNRDFFIHRVLPELERVSGGKIREKISSLATVGARLSSG
jgi:hypothetical protein